MQPRPRKTVTDYIEMQKRHYENRNFPVEQIGFYDWHENFPYETQLLYKNGDLRMPLLSDSRNKLALDFGCGPGRMIKRMSTFFERVDGVDISEYLIDEARRRYPKSNFYVSSGKDTGDAPINTYDFVFSTITIQHIAVHEIRMEILKSVHKVLKPGGTMTIQMAFNPNYPFTKRGEIRMKNFQIQLLNKRTDHASWDENRTDAPSTNSVCDVAINNDDLPRMKSDVGSIFKNVEYWFYDVSLIFANLNGKKHATDYWPTHWIFIHGTK